MRRYEMNSPGWRQGQVAEVCKCGNKISVSCILVEFVTGEFLIYPGDGSVLKKGCVEQDYSLLYVYFDGYELSHERQFINTLPEVNSKRHIYTYKREKGKHTRTQARLWEHNAMCQQHERTSVILLLTLMSQCRPSSLLTVASIHTNSLESTL